MGPTEDKIARRLTDILAPGSPNKITAADLRKWAIDYLTDHDEELNESPELAAEPHWNLWMMDARFEDAVFAVLVFRPDDVEFFCGIGDAFAIKQFVGSDFPNEVEQLLREMTMRFTVPEGSLHFSRKETEVWLGRGW